METIHEHLAHLSCPDEQKIPIRGKVQIAFARGLMNTLEEHPITEPELDGFVYHGEEKKKSNFSVQITTLRHTLNPFGWTIVNIRKTSEKPAEYYIDDIRMKTFRKGVSRGFLVVKRS